MTFEHISLLRNIGQFDFVNAGAHLPLSKLSLIQGFTYAKLWRYFDSYNIAAGTILT